VVCKFNKGDSVHDQSKIGGMLELLLACVAILKEKVCVYRRLY